MSEVKEMNHLDKCPICEGTELKDFLKTKDFTFSKEKSYYLGTS